MLSCLAIKSGLYFPGFWFICSEFKWSCRLFFSSFRFVTGALIAGAHFNSLCMSEKHYHFSFHQLLPYNCKRSFTSCPQLWSSAQLSHGSWSPTDVSMPRSAPRSLFWSSGEGLWRVFLGRPGSTWPGSPAEGKPHKPRLSRDNLDDCLVTLLYFILAC